MDGEGLADWATNLKLNWLELSMERGFEGKDRLLTCKLYDGNDAASPLCALLWPFG